MKIAAVQCDVTIGQTESNLAAFEQNLREAAAQGAQLVIFPECAVTGYCFEDLREAQQYAQPLPGAATERMSAVCRELNIYSVFGSLEADDDEVYNVAVLVGPEGLIGRYRKTHLPYLGVDRFTSFGRDPYVVFDAGPVRVGMLICYDASFPEASRSLALAGADLIVLPTNWPPGAEHVAQYAINTRAMENGVYFAAVNRVGDERGFSFIGQSRICDPNGNTLVAADHRRPEMLLADIDPVVARQKEYVRVPGLHIIDRFADRRPELYGALTEPHDLPRPGRDQKGS